MVYFFIFELYNLQIFIMSQLQGKNVIVTGATRGIGRGIALKMAAEGAHVAFTYSASNEAAVLLENELKNLGVKAKGYQSDAADFNAAQEMVAEVIKEFGSVDVLINNAGITKDNLLMRMSEEDFDKVIQVNLKSVFNMTKAVIKPMMSQRKGSIINMSSVVGVKGNAGQANYAASKAGIIGFTKSVALELGSRNIRCNAIAPGFIETEMTAVLDENTVNEWRKSIPLKRGGTPEDVANACVFLASDNSAYITGQTLNVDGGMLT
jgi:3-oxoacyl-[acyl-carrier protein] reductase